MPNLNEIRDISIRIQKDAGMKSMYVPVSSSDTYQYINGYCDALVKKKTSFVLVLDMALDNKDLKQIVDKYCNICEEIVFLYRTWSKYRTNYDYVLSKSLKVPDKFHMAFIPVDLNDYGDGKILSTYVMCSKFKSISLMDTPFKGRRPKAKTMPKSLLEQMNSSKWIDGEYMVYSKIHDSECSCCSGKDANQLIRTWGVKELITHHNLEILSTEYSKLKNDDEYRKKILELDSMKALSNSLKLS